MRSEKDTLVAGWSGHTCYIAFGVLSGVFMAWDSWRQNTQISPIIPWCRPSYQSVFLWLSEKGEGRRGMRLVWRQDKRHFTIVGAGMAGLTMALLLVQLGHQVPPQSNHIDLITPSVIMISSHQVSSCHLIRLGPSSWLILYWSLKKLKKATKKLPEKDLTWIHTRQSLLPSEAN